MAGCGERKEAVDGQIMCKSKNLKMGVLTLGALPDMVKISVNSYRMNSYRNRGGGIRMKVVNIGLVLVAVLFMAASSQATVTDVVWYHMGEQQSNTTPGSTTTDPQEECIINFDAPIAFGGTPPVISADVSPLTRWGSPIGHTNPGHTVPSNLSTMIYDADVYKTNSAVLQGQAGNWGIEGWFKPTSANMGRYFYNGHGGLSGMGIWSESGQWKIFLGGQGFFASGVAVTPNVWTHVAAVTLDTSSPTLGIYIDGQLATSLAVIPTPIGATSWLDFGGQDNNEWRTEGLFDELRIFSFSPGQFNSETDLNYVPEPATMLLLGLGGICLRARSKRS